MAQAVATPTMSIRDQMNEPVEKNEPVEIPAKNVSPAMIREAKPYWTFRLYLGQRHYWQLLVVDQANQFQASGTMRAGEEYRRTCSASTNGTQPPRNSSAPSPPWSQRPIAETNCLADFDCASSR